MFCLRPVKKLSRHKISWPSLSSRSHKCEPRKPAPPVMRIRISVTLNGAQGGLWPQLKKCPTPGAKETPNWLNSAALGMLIRRGNIFITHKLPPLVILRVCASRPSSLLIVAEIAKSSEHGTVRHDCHDFVLKMRRVSYEMPSWNLAPHRPPYLRRRSYKSGRLSRARDERD
jgi:hypothetical protein